MPLGDEQFEEHIRTRTQKPPSTLYKYTMIRVAQSILSGKKIRFQSPLRYNDPFDSQWDPLWPLSTPEALAYERKVSKQAICDPTSWPDDASPEFKEAMDQERNRINSLPVTERERAVEELIQQCESSRDPAEPFANRIRDIRRRLRICCLCENDRSILMWSHYAEQHRGVLLGFDSKTLEDGLRRPLESIDYQNGPPRLIDDKAWIKACVYGLGQGTEWLGCEREWALTKHIDWRYEKEWRFVWVAVPGTDGEYEDYHFPTDSLVELTVGCRTDPNDEAELRALACEINPSMRHCRMRIQPGRFELLKEDVKDTTHSD